MKAQVGMLKLQLDPHFIFNSLNALIGLIEENPKKAVDFTLDLSRIYKYIIAHIDDDTIPLKDGINFITEYCHHILLRYPSQFNIEIEHDKIQAKDWEKLLPLSLQLLVENAVKHNQHTEQRPLYIRIYRKKEYICVSNDYKPYPDENRQIQIASSGIGMKNLFERYKLLTYKIPITIQSEKTYTVKIPII